MENNKLQLTQAMREEAKRYPNGYLYQIVGNYGPNDTVPPKLSPVPGRLMPRATSLETLFPTLILGDQDKRGKRRGLVPPAADGGKVGILCYVVWTARLEEMHMPTELAKTMVRGEETGERLCIA